MNTRTMVERGWWPALLLLALLAPVPAAWAQSAVGGGPLTANLTDTEPTSGVLSVGPFKLAPGIVVREIGWDSNVFDLPDDEEPKSDYVAAAVPDVAIFTRLRFVKVSAYAGADLTYFQQYESERSVGYAGRGRVDVLLSRVRPFVAAGQNRTRTRPNGEIDTRANRLEHELSGGLAFDLGTHSLIYASTNRSGVKYENAFEDDVDLGQALSRDGVEYSGGLKTDLTPLASLTLSGAYREDSFRADRTRDADSRILTASVRLAPEAIVTGNVAISFSDFKAVDPKVKPFRGITGSAGLMYSFLEVGRFNLAASRSQEYSFDVKEAYYLQNTLALSYNHRLFGAIDGQLRGGRTWFDYGYREGTPPHQDTMDTAEASVGYNLRNRTRVSVNYEYTRRRSAQVADKNYQRRRVFLNWSYAF